MGEILENHMSDKELMFIQYKNYYNSIKSKISNFKKWKNISIVFLKRDI